MRVWALQSTAARRPCAAECARGRGTPPTAAPVAESGVASREWLRGHCATATPYLARFPHPDTARPPDQFLIAGSGQSTIDGCRRGARVASVRGNALVGASGTAMKSVRPNMARIRQGNRRRIVAALRNGDILRRVTVHAGGRLEVDAVTWRRYWSPVLKLFPTPQREALFALERVRRAFVESRFDMRMAPAYCHAYFSLLRSLVDAVQEQGLGQRPLAAALSMESCPLSEGDRDEIVAAATSNVRSPAYLLARLRQPEAYNDPKFVPLIAVRRKSRATGPPIDLFYHYRQFPLDSDDGISLLACPAVQPKTRGDSFRCLQLLSAALAHRTDPRTVNRSKWITDHAIAPFLQGLGCHSPDDRAAVAIADLGGGSGDLTRRVCERLLADFPDVMKGRELAWTLVDLRPHNTRRLAKRKRLLRNLVELRCERLDWLQWVQRCMSAPVRPRFDVVLCCRLLDNLSRFSIGWVDDWYQVRKLSRRRLARRDWQRGSHLPHECLAPEGPGAPALLASNARVPLIKGTTFLQLSLTDYYRAIHLLTQGPPPADVRPEAVFFPIRRFAPESLSLPLGGSALGAMCSFSSLVVIEDIDLTPGMLRRHLSDHKLADVAASDATNRTEMHGTNLLCLSRKELRDCLPGRRIW